MRRTGHRWIQEWEPEDERFWAASGARIAGRNLAWSILAENLGFSIWLVWSVLVVSLKPAGHHFTINQLFWLVSLPNLVGSTLRLPYTFAVPRFGGRNWTLASVALLFVPVLALIGVVGDPGATYGWFLAAAAAAGLGGGNFASSMANISFFYPDRRKGLALGLNAAGGNLGVAVVQLVIPLIVTASVIGAGQGPARSLHLQNAGLLWLPLLVVALVGAYFFMNNLAPARSNFRDQLAVTRDPHTWLMSLLYVGTFGSFIGYSAAFPLLLKTQFPHVIVTHYAFLGALVGSLSRPLGGWLADRAGGARVTLACFGVTMGGVVLVIAALGTTSFAFYLGAFLVVFVTSGMGNGSTYRMIPVIFRERAAAVEADPAAALVAGRRSAAAAIGIVSAVGAYGGFLIPRGFATSIDHTGNIDAALYVFLGFYVVCMAITWSVYVRRPAEAASPSRAALAASQV